LDIRCLLDRLSSAAHDQRAPEDASHRTKAHQATPEPAEPLR
jgi:hypothetical protein